MGFDFLIDAADRGHINSMHYVARAFDTGIGLPKIRCINQKHFRVYFKCSI